MKTTLPKEKEIQRAWHLMDATGVPAGRLAVRICHLLRGKHKPIYTPHIDTGDFVVVINASKVKLTGAKEEQKIYKSFSGYPSGLKEVPAAAMRARQPSVLITHAVKSMLPKNHLSRTQFERLKVYAGDKHRHVAQNPQPIA